MGSCGMVTCVSGQGPLAGACEYGNETSGSIKDGELLGYLSNC
jgi:hypothetical protein